MVGPKVTRDVETELNYWIRPLPNNYMEVDFTTGDEAQKVKDILAAWKPYPVKIHDIRGRESECSLYRNGFEYVHHEVPGLSEAASEEEIKKLLVPVTEQLVKDRLGATIVRTHATRIRSKATDTNLNNDNQSPAFDTHSDLTPPGGIHFLEWKFPDHETLLATHRVFSINVWRPLKTITRNPLAVLDWPSCNFERDWVSRKYTFGVDWWTIIGAIKFHEEHKWYYMSHQTSSDVLLFTQFDTENMEEGGRCVAHTSFVDPEYVDGPARESIEIKMFAFVPK
ncbi:hypothetical protein Tdes44962_MAKER06331 [Teratosphaeria destructans]|uniref:Uncharacterized protein n=1 Tax=Teratosphaeria destructans TaxID=418781 RepID=A0A9W7SHP8_9PEZI|nr:hypothetical protein Tdes44962_MAKER06331 [Teratosphaeria destructans]